MRVVEYKLELPKVRITVESSLPNAKGIEELKTVEARTLALAYAAEKLNMPNMSLNATTTQPYPVTEEGVAIDTLAENGKYDPAVHRVSKYRIDIVLMRPIGVM